MNAPAPVAPSTPPPPAKSSPVGAIITIIVLLLAVGGAAWWFFARRAQPVSPVVVAQPVAPPPAPQALPAWPLDKPATVTAFQFGGDGADVIEDMVTRPDGRLVIAGTTTSVANLPNARQRHQLLDSAAGTSHGFVAELSPDGQVIL